MPADYIIDYTVFTPFELAMRLRGAQQCIQDPANEELLERAKEERRDVMRELRRRSEHTLKTARLQVDKDNARLVLGYTEEYA